MSWTDGIETTVTKTDTEWAIVVRRGNIEARFTMRPDEFQSPNMTFDEAVEKCVEYGQRAVLEKEIEEEFGTYSLAVEMIRTQEEPVFHEMLLEIVAYESNARHGKHSWDGEPPVGDEIDQRIIAYIMENSKPYPETVA